jgi:hypothetical protein
MENGVNGYKGLNRDTAYDSMPTNSYIDALDIRVSTARGESTGAISNIEGNTLYVSLPPTGTFNGSNWNSLVPEIIGSTSIRDRLIIFVADNSGQKGWIYELTYSNTNTNFTALTLKYYSPSLNFNKDWPIEAVGRYESDCFRRIYWTDYNNPYRSINLEDANLATFTVDVIDAFPSVTFTQPLLTGVLAGGVLPVGTYVYSYRLTTFDGKQTLAAPGSNLISCVNDSESLIQSAQYNGAPDGTNSGKTHEITIDTSSYAEYETIELISIFYSDLASLGEVTSVETKNIGGAATVTFFHTGSENTITTLEPIEFTLKQYPFKTFKTLTPKDNSLVVANVKGGAFSIASLLDPNESFNALTRRYDSGSDTPHPIGTGYTDDDYANAFNVEYNKDAHWDTNWHTNEQYKYQSDGVTLGGEGDNISYKFHLEEFQIDGSPTPGFANLFPNSATPNLNDGYNYSNTTYSSQVSPFISGLLKSYKRGETYRVGLVVYNLKGEASYVDYIGDIKFPDISDADGANNASDSVYFPLSREDFSSRTGSTAVTNAYALGLDITIDFSTCPNLLNKISGYQIVRVKREQTDKRRLCSGIIRTGHLTTGIGAANPDFDFRGPNAETSVYHLLPHTPHYGHNANFCNLSNEFHDTAEGGSAWPYVEGEYLAYYTPEVSFDFEDRGDEIVDNASSYLLVTGAYTQYFSDTSTGTIQNDLGDLLAPNYWTNNQYADHVSYNVVRAWSTSGSEDLGTKASDRRKTCRTVLAIDRSTAARGIEAVKKWKEKKRVTYDNTQDAAELTAEWDNATLDIDGDIFRGYYQLTARDNGANWALQNANLPIGNNTTEKEVFKGATGIMGKIEKVSTDPLDGSTLGTVSKANFFVSYGDGSVADGVTGDFTSAGLRVIPDFQNINNPDGATTLTIPNVDTELNVISTPIVDTLVPRGEVYGGNSKSTLDFNTFIPASPIINKTGTDPVNAHNFQMYGGDTFLSMWTFQEQSAMLDMNYFGGGTRDYTGNKTLTTVFVVESELNVGIAYGATIKTGVRNEVTGSGGPIVEWRQEIDNDETDQGEVLDMYENAYYRAYSREKDMLAFFTNVNDDGSECQKNDIRAYLSDVKTNEETIDSWTNFGLNNFYDVDDNGSINKILNFKDTVYFFQDTAVGAYSINPRAIVSTGDGIPTELGSGQGFQDHQYITNEHGAIHQWGVQATDTGIYYFDGIHKKVFRITQGNEPLSEIGGLHSFFNEFKGDVLARKEDGGDNPIQQKGVLISRDKVNDEVLFTFHGIIDALAFTANTTFLVSDIILISGDYYLVTNQFTSSASPGIGELTGNATRYTPDTSKTVVYDELVQSFTSFYSATPTIYLENGNILLSSNGNNDLYIHNKGNFGEFYGNTEEAYIQLVINHNADLNKVIRFIEFNSIVRDKNKTISRDKTITAFRLQTEYQDTGKITDTDRIKRRFDKWRLKIPRETGDGKSRLRSTHFTLTLYYDNTENKELILNRIISFFDIQMF